MEPQAASEPELSPPAVKSWRSITVDTAFEPPSTAAGWLRSPVSRHVSHKLHAVSAFRDAKVHHKLFSKDRLRELRNPMREYKHQCEPSHTGSTLTPPHQFPSRTFVTRHRRRRLTADCV